MTAAKTTHIFLDANTALHFKKPDLIDWAAITGSKHVVLVGAPVFSREIEKQKVHNPSAKLRKRADSYIKWLVAFVRDPSQDVRPRVRWNFIPAEPLIDFRENNLSSEISDDHLIASVISYEPPEHADVLVATADIGLEIKLLSRGIKPLHLPEDAKLPDELDAQEKELQDMRRKMAQKHLPKLELLTATDDSRHLFTLRPHVAKSCAVSPEEMERKHPPLGSSKNLTPQNMAALSAEIQYQIMCAEMCGTLLTPERADKYNRERDAFLANYREYHRKLLQWEEHAALIVGLELTLSNGGTAPATDIDIILRFPEDIILFELADFPERPKEPEPPHRPNCTVFSDLSQLLLGGPDYSKLLSTSYVDLLHPDASSSASIDADENHIHYSPGNLKHGFTEEIERMYFRFPGRGSVRQFHAEYEISSAELPETARGEIHFVLS